MSESRIIAHGAAYMLSSSLVFNLFSLAFYITIVRLLPPDTLGVFYSLTIVLTFATTFALLSLPAGFGRFMTAAAQTDKIEEARYLFRRGILAAGGIMIVTTPILILLSPMLSVWLFSSTGFTSLLYLVTIDFAIFVLNSFLVLPLSATRRFASLGILQVLYGAIRFGFAIALVLLGVGLPALIYGWIVSDIFYLGAYAYLSIPFFKGSERRTSLRDILPYSLPLFISSGIVLALQNVDRLFVLKYLGLAALGVYGTILIASGIPQLLPTAVGNALFPAMMKAEHLENLPKEFVTKAIRYISIITIPLLGLVASLGKPFIQVLLGSNISFAWVSFAVLTLGNAAMCPDIPLGQVLAAKKATRIIGIQQIVSGGCLAGFAILLIPPFFLTGAALAYVLARVAGFAFILPFLYRFGYFNVEWEEYGKIIASTVVTAAATIIAETLTGFSSYLLPGYLVFGGVILVVSARLFGVLRAEDYDVILDAVPLSLRPLGRSIWKLMRLPQPG
ncbi:MAG: oligosaccharide flippase family protein [Thaumarchaeota archaeon]|nr:oligosaccharide flippase family protein [Nitrososphaerota archaeon]